MGYGYDKAGQVNNVSGSGYAGVSNYANTFSYRAFGAIKGMTYNNGRTLTTAYDSRLRPTTWSVSNVLGFNYNYDHFQERTGRVSYAQSIYDATLDRSYEYDQLGRLAISHSGAEARAHAYSGQWGTQDGPYSQGYDYDVWGNVTHKYGWGGEVQGGSPAGSTDLYYSYTNNKRNGFSYDAAGNLTNDLGQTFTYDATGQQATASYSGYSLQQWYDGDGLRVKKNDNGAQTYYLRSSVLGGQVVAEIIWASVSWQWSRGYVYLGSQLLAVQQGGVFWIHEDPITKSKRVTNSAGTVVSTVELDPWGADTNRSNNTAFQPRKFTSYTRDNNGSDEAMFRRSNRWHSRFDQPDPYDGSYSMADPQSFNRYAYVRNDPVNFVDPSGLLLEDPAGMSRPRDGGNAYGFWSTIGAMHLMMDMLFDVPWQTTYTYENGQLVIKPFEISVDVGYNGSSGQSYFGIFGVSQNNSNTIGGFGFDSGLGSVSGRSTPNPTPKTPPDPCVNSPYVNFSLGGGNMVAGGSISILASNRGIYVQFGYGSVFQTPIGNAPRTSRFARFSKLGVSPAIRFSKSGISDGWGSTTDFTYYAQNFDEHGNPAGKEFGFVGLPSASGQTTYTTRLWNVNGCK